ncbi:MerR family transcriptional regulator [Mycolicibacterium sp. XJ1819]
MTRLPTSEREDADEPKFTVRVVADRLGVPTATLRSWNRRYGVGPSAHRPGRHRLYSENDISAVRQMHELIVHGASPRSAARAAIDSVRPSHGDYSTLLAAAFELDVVAVGLLLDRHLRHFGVVGTWDHVVRPAFAAIEAQQADGVGCIDVEHALSWAVSRALHRMPVAPAAGSIVLAATAGEAHTLALEALRAALAERGVGALMLGADVPPVALFDAVRRSERPVSVMLWSQTSRTADAHTLAAVAADADVLVGGPGWGPAPVQRRSPATLGDAVDHFLATASVSHRSS